MKAPHSRSTNWCDDTVAATVFKSSKRSILSSLQREEDRSPKGSIDLPVRALVARVNAASAYVTTSSCSGRVAIYEHLPESSSGRSTSISGDVEAGSTKGSGRWLYVNHGPNVVTEGEFATALAGAWEGSTAILKVEPFILHVQCCNVAAARALMLAAVSSGYRESGISVGSNSKCIVAVRTTASSMEVPLRLRGQTVVNEAYLRVLVGEANSRMMEIAARRGRFEAALDVCLASCPAPPSPPREDNQKAGAPPQPPLSAPYACTVCGTAFLSRNQLFGHLVDGPAAADRSLASFTDLASPPPRRRCPTEAARLLESGVAAAGAALLAAAAVGPIEAGTQAAGAAAAAPHAKTASVGTQDIRAAAPTSAPQLCPEAGHPLSFQGVAHPVLHDNNSSSSGGLSCSVCSESFASRNRLFAHLRGCKPAAATATAYRGTASQMGPGGSAASAPPSALNKKASAPRAEERRSPANSLLLPPCTELTEEDYAAAAAAHARAARLLQGTLGSFAGDASTSTTADAPAELQWGLLHSAEAGPSPQLWGHSSTFLPAASGSGSSASGPLDAEYPHGVVLCFGGFSGGGKTHGRSGAVALYDTASGTWVADSSDDRSTDPLQTDAQRPCPRTRHTAVAVPRVAPLSASSASAGARRRDLGEPASTSAVLLFGGHNGLSRPLNDAWWLTLRGHAPSDGGHPTLRYGVECTPVAYADTSPLVPSVRWGHSAACLTIAAPAGSGPPSSAVLAFGGRDSHRSLGDLWCAEVMGQPNAAGRDEGGKGEGPPSLGEGEASLSLTVRWSELQPTGAGPSPRFYHAAVSLLAGGAPPVASSSGARPLMLLHGGYAAPFLHGEHGAAAACGDELATAPSTQVLGDFYVLHGVLGAGGNGGGSGRGSSGASSPLLLSHLHWSSPQLQLVSRTLAAAAWERGTAGQAPKSSATAIQLASPSLASLHRFSHSLVALPATGPTHAGAATHAPDHPVTVLLLGGACSDCETNGALLLRVGSSPPPLHDGPSSQLGQAGEGPPAAHDSAAHTRIWLEPVGDSATYSGLLQAAPSPAAASCAKPVDDAPQADVGGAASLSPPPSATKQRKVGQREPPLPAAAPGSPHRPDPRRLALMVRATHVVVPPPVGALLSSDGETAAAAPSQALLSIGGGGTALAFGSHWSAPCWAPLDRLPPPNPTHHRLPRGSHAVPAPQPHAAQRGPPATLSGPALLTRPDALEWVRRAALAAGWFDLTRKCGRCGGAEGDQRGTATPTSAVYGVPITDSAAAALAGAGCVPCPAVHACATAIGAGDDSATPAGEEPAFGASSDPTRAAQLQLTSLLLLRRGAALCLSAALPVFDPRRPGGERAMERLRAELRAFLLGRAAASKDTVEEWFRPGAPPTALRTGGPHGRAASHTGVPDRVEWVGDILVLPPGAFTHPRWAPFTTPLPAPSLPPAAAHGEGAGTLLSAPLWEVVARVFGAERVARHAEVAPDGTRSSRVSMLRSKCVPGAYALPAAPPPAAAPPAAVAPTPTAAEEESLRLTQAAGRAAAAAEARLPSPDFTSGGWTRVRENGLTYALDLTRVMFSSGNGSEKARMGALQGLGASVVVDLFAGIGYFTLPLLLRARALHVHACDWNPDAVTLLKLNLALNGVPASRCSVWPGDNSTFLARSGLAGAADRVLLGLIPTSELAWETAVACLKPAGGILHVHMNLSEAELRAPGWADGFADRFAAIGRRVTQRHDWRVAVQHLEYVKSYAPHVWHVVVDVGFRGVG